MKYLVLVWDLDTYGGNGGWEVVWWGTNLRDARRELKAANGPHVKLVRVETLEEITY